MSPDPIEPASRHTHGSCFAVIPAAGRSTRMQPHHKLLLDWNGRGVIEHVLDAWTQSAVDRVVIVVREDDDELRRIGAARCIDVVSPEVDPDDMKRSIQCGLEHVRQNYQPKSSDRWLVAPADLPTLGADLINQVVKASRGAESIVVPRFGGRQGHPVSFPWRMASNVDALRPNQGINTIVAENATIWLDLPATERPRDIDTPEDYRRLHG